VRAIFALISILSAAFVPAWGQDAAPAPGEAPIEGSVFNKVTGVPVKQAHVTFLRLAQAPGEDAIQTYVDTDAGGHYSARLTAGQYRIWVERAGFRA
jgi:hypothetical protein